MQWTIRQGLQYNNYQIKLTLVDRATLTALLKDRSTKDSLGVTSHSVHTINGRVTRIEVAGISVYAACHQSCSRVLLSMKLAMHGWQDRVFRVFQHGPK